MKGKKDLLEERSEGTIHNEGKGEQEMKQEMKEKRKKKRKKERQERVGLREHDEQ